MLEMQTAGKVCHTKGPTGKNNHQCELFTVRVCSTIRSDFAVSKEVHQLGSKNCLAIAGIRLYPTSLYLTNF